MGALHKLVAPWLLDADSDHLMNLLQRIAWLDHKLFDEYEPDDIRSFDDRLADWLSNVSDETDRQLMFRMIDYLFFIAKPQFDSLCQATFNGDVIRWIIDLEAIPLSAPNLDAILQRESSRTWFCPITDSMRINSFLKVNKLRGHDFRADFRSLANLGDSTRVQNYVKEKDILRIVLLEDFVGSGNQMTHAVEWAASILPEIQILVAPLVCCPDGAVTGHSLAAEYSNVEFSPTLALDQKLFLLPAPQTGEPGLFPEFRALVRRLQPRLAKWARQPFGYEDTGAIIALYSNCPDNTIAMIHDSNPAWNALFPRVERG